MSRVCDIPKTHQILRENHDTRIENVNKKSFKKCIEFNFIIWLVQINIGKNSCCNGIERFFFYK